MKNFRSILRLAAMICFCKTILAQSPELVLLHESDTSAFVMKLWRRKGNTGLTILLPPYGGDHNYYDTSILPDSLLPHGTDFGVAFPGFTGYFDQGDIQKLDSLFDLVCTKYSYDRRKIALGGFSAGGYGAMRYALVQSRTNSLSVSPAALFSVDAPLDLERWYKGMDMFLQRVGDSSNINYGEFAYLTGMFRNMFHGSPAEVPEAYRQLSVVSASLADGGNARYFSKIPLRLYSEPDMDYFVEQGLDYNSINAADQVAMANILKILGNTNVSLVLTSGKGYRPEFNNLRTPHAWSIVDETDLARWIIKNLK